MKRFHTIDRAYVLGQLRGMANLMQCSPGAGVAIVAATIRRLESELEFPTCPEVADLPPTNPESALKL